LLLSGTFLPFATKRVPLSVNRTNQSFKMIAQTPNIINKRILQIAVPSIISNITVPLLGLIDVTIVGHLGAAAYIGAIAVGGMLFNIIYWIFGFLRMGTSGMTSQAYGKHDLDEVARLLLRSVGVGLLIAIILVALQYPIRKLAFTFIQTTEEVERLATLYFRICIWGAPAMLGLYGFAGWFIGMQNSRFPMYIAITQNIVNIAASLCFVYLFHMKVAGVAWGTLTAQYAGFLMALLLWRRYYGGLKKHVAWHEVLKKEAMLRFFQVNRDIFLRTLCLVIVTLFFTSAGAAQGEIVLAVNTLLMQLFTLFSYIMDGFAYSGEALVGKYVGANNQPALYRTVRQLFIWGVGLSTGFTLLYFFGGKSFLGLLTNEISVIREAENYFYWVLAIPLTGFAAFLWDGIFIGATATRQMFYSMLVASSSFFLVYYSLHEWMGNHALWLAFIVYLSLRGIMQAALSRKILYQS
jgi:MATE family multidrug resistance protein